MLREKEYYHRMSNFDKLTSFEVICRWWRSCFYYALKHLNSEYTEKVSDSLFYDWDMSNWRALWPENSEDYGKSIKTLRNTFNTECLLISDRISYDRLFRTHWLFRYAYREEFAKVLDNRRGKLWK